MLRARLELNHCNIDLGAEILGDLVSLLPERQDTSDAYEELAELDAERIHQMFATNEDAAIRFDLACFRLFCSPDGVFVHARRLRTEPEDNFIDDALLYAERRFRVQVEEAEGIGYFVADHDRWDWDTRYRALTPRRARIGRKCSLIRGFGSLGADPGSIWINSVLFVCFRPGNPQAPLFSETDLST